MSASNTSIGARLFHRWMTDASFRASFNNNAGRFGWHHAVEEAGYHSSDLNDAERDHLGRVNWGLSDQGLLNNMHQRAVADQWG